MSNWSKETLSTSVLILAYLYICTHEKYMESDTLDGSYFAWFGIYIYIYRVFQKELYSFEKVYKFIQRT